jgi:hypothetical protein
MQEWHGVRDTVIHDRPSTETLEKLVPEQCCKRNLEKTDVREETLGATGIQQRHNEQRPKRAIMSGKQDTQQDFRQTLELEIAKQTVGT